MKQIGKILLLLWLWPFSVSAQQKDHQIIVLANPRGDSITIRWAPASFLVWQLGNKYGYNIERFVIALDGTAVHFSSEEGKRLNTTPLLPMPEQEMEKLSVNDEKTAIVKEAVYGKEFNITTPEKGIGDFITKQGEGDMRFGFALLACDLSSNAASAAGLRFVDHNIKKNERYAYRISLVHQPQGLVVEPAITVTSLNEPVQLSPPREFSVRFEDRLAKLQWLSSLDKAIYTAYLLERSLDGKNFKPVSDLPVISTGDQFNQQFSYYTDTLADNETVYYYRIRGLSPFAETGPYSTVVKGQGKPFYDRPIIDSVASVDNKQIYLQWHLPPALKLKARAIIITQASKVEGPYKDISEALPQKTISYLDKKPLTNAYYRLKIKTSDDQVIYSLPHLGQIIDDIPPVAPISLTGKVDSNGVVYLSWQPNHETDLQGYRVFRANALQEEFVEVTNELIRENFFTDTIEIQTLTKKVYYKIVAVDNVFNPSDYSAILELSRPDKIAPSAPLFTESIMLDSIPGIQLKWRTSSSKDVARQELFRLDKTNAGLTKKIILLDSTNTITEWTDADLVLGHTYYYELQSVDEAGNRSADRSGDVFFETGKRAAMKDITGVLDRNRKQIRLSWANPQKAAVFYLYRSVNDLPFLLNKKLDGSVTGWTDEEVQPGNRYSYKIKTEWYDGTRTQISKAVTIVY